MQCNVIQYQGKAAINDLERIHRTHSYGKRIGYSMLFSFYGPTHLSPGDAAARTVEFTLSPPVFVPARVKCSKHCSTNQQTTTKLLLIEAWGLKALAWKKVNRQSTGGAVVIAVWNTCRSWKLSYFWCGVWFVCERQRWIRSCSHLIYHTIARTSCTIEYCANVTVLMVTLILSANRWEETGFSGRSLGWLTIFHTSAQTSIIFKHSPSSNLWSQPKF